MSYWGEQVNALTGSFFGSDYLRDYTHAAKTFRPNGYQYTPKFKFLFHVYFDINQNVYPVGLATGANFGLLVKSVKLPSFTFDTETLNQYNRKRIVQTKIRYDDISITFHDDNGNLIRNLWYYYFQYHYADPNKNYPDPSSSVLPGGNNSTPLTINNQTGPVSYNKRNIYDKSITGDTDWGYVGEGSVPPDAAAQSLGQSKVPFFKNITIYGFNQKNFVAYSLINPIISQFSHDTYSYAESSGTMENSMTIQYETVKYYQGAIKGSNPQLKVPGFGAPQTYDTRPSPLAKPGSQNTILGQGGLVDAGSGILTDLTSEPPNLLRAAMTAGTAYNTFKNVNLGKSLLSEVKVAATNAYVSGSPTVPTRNLPFNFPSFGSSPSKYGTAGAPNNGKTAPDNVDVS